VQSQLCKNHYFPSGAPQTVIAARPTFFKEKASGRAMCGRRRFAL
jgi:hypothetical protein